uniref:ribosomal protein S3 n=1 Tax=Schizosaccharomyces osmophilus TaxID=2545709 RepID=UPI00237A7CB2|nr:ribosomal protein S3 [Schizosaccharomyces osmophilus]WCA44836.1 ribosomal protein S3 [Schizosaccharomyces osmophilus]
MNLNLLQSFSLKFLTEFFSNSSKSFAIGKNVTLKPNLLLGQAKLNEIYNANDKVIYGLQFPFFYLNQMNSEESEKLFLFLEWKLNIFIYKQLTNFNFNSCTFSNNLIVKLMPYEMETPYSDSLILAKYTAWILSANKKYTNSFLKDPISFLNNFDNHLPLEIAKLKSQSFGLNKVSLKGLQINYNLIKPNIIAQKGNTIEVTKGSCPIFFIPSLNNGFLDQANFSILSKVGTVNIKVKLFFNFN